ncbi:hypothetical protein, unknown function [Leishmania mexicana MHOM/GT/2001/U1103]|uniref:Amastin-like protein n=1 Tax=Leishmania mexicana (strain MHOM/GT/2001/U1103) TaxID=929439 RepID=E9AQK8_LEIMU|nr:hypothetical protein, unknown function [Leishmania mexicana MHOM/GT/2001/U1103]CBZ25227.1 hypothetical protein, unknown function [Leishmania mexicana MHOM/GT/2001/U1103]
MRCCRLILLLLMLLFTGCIVAAILLPIYRKDSNETVLTKYRVFFWFNESINVSGTPPSTLILRTYSFAILCQKARIFFIVMAILSVVAAAIAGVACLTLACWTMAGYNISLGVTSLLLTIFAMLFSVVVLAAAVFVFKTDFCVSEGMAYLQAPRTNGYRLGEGFFLLCIAVGGFLLLVVMQALCLCCDCRSRPVRSGRACDTKNDTSNLQNGGPYP